MKQLRKHSVALIVRDNEGRVLAVQRPVEDELGAVWGFPAASKEKKDETWEHVARRVASEKLGVSIELGKCLGEDVDNRGDYFLTLRDYEATIASGEVVVPQTSSLAKGTQYTKHMWVDDLSIFIPAAKNHSVCTRIFLDSENIDWKNS